MNWTASRLNSIWFSSEIFSIEGTIKSLKTGLHGSILFQLKSINRLVLSSPSASNCEILGGGRVLIWFLNNFVFWTMIKLRNVKARWLWIYRINIMYRKCNSNTVLRGAISLRPPPSWDTPFPLPIWVDWDCLTKKNTFTVFSFRPWYKPPDFSEFIQSKNKLDPNDFRELPLASWIWSASAPLREVAYSVFIFKKIPENCFLFRGYFI